MCSAGDGSVSSSGDGEPDNIWNALLETMVHLHIGEALQPLLTDEEMGKVALTCRFACDALCAELYNWDEVGCA